MRDEHSYQTSQKVQRFYNQHPYPPPVKDLDRYRERWLDEGRRRADYHLHWPHKPFRADLSILVAGCGTSQAAKHALRHPAARVVGIDISETSLQHTQALKRKYKLDNLEVLQLPVERAGELGSRFDQVICTGVLHHLPDPLEGLRALKDVLEPGGALHLMVYAVYGRMGISMVQKVVRQLGIGDSDQEIRALADSLMALPLDHPLARLLAESPDFRSKQGLADALLNPKDRAYSVPELFELIHGAGLQFGRWVRQAPYLPQCGAFAETPIAPHLAQLPAPACYAALELLRGTMLRHSFIVYREEGAGEGQAIHFEGDDWLSYVPVRLPETILLEERLPPGAAKVLINQSHTYPDIYLPIDAAESQLFEQVTGSLSIARILERVPVREAQDLERARSLFERLWWFDQVVFDASK